MSTTALLAFALVALLGMVRPTLDRAPAGMLLGLGVAMVADAR